MPPFPVPTELGLDLEILETFLQLLTGAQMEWENYHSQEETSL